MARILPLVDLTSPGEDDDRSTVERLCTRAVTPNGEVAAVCAWPRFAAADALAGTALGGGLLDDVLIALGG